MTMPPTSSPGGHDLPENNNGPLSSPTSNLPPLPSSDDTVYTNRKSLRSSTRRRRHDAASSSVSKHHSNAFSSGGITAGERRLTRSRRGVSGVGVKSSPTPATRSRRLRSSAAIDEDEQEQIEQQQEEEHEQEQDPAQEEHLIDEDKNEEEANGDDTAMRLPPSTPSASHPSKLPYETPYKNVDTHVADHSIFSSETGHDHEMSDPVEEEEAEQQEQGPEQPAEIETEDEAMYDNDDNEAAARGGEIDSNVHRRASQGSKVRNHRESGGIIARNSFSEENQLSEDEQGEEEEDQAEEQEEQTDQEGGSDIEEEDEATKTVLIPLETPSRPSRTVPRRLLAGGSVAASSPGRTPLARRPAGVAATPAANIGMLDLDFTTPAIVASAAAITHQQQLRTPFLHHGTPLPSMGMLSASRPSAVSHYQLAMQNEALAEQIKAIEAENKFLRGIAEGAGVIGINGDMEVKKSPSKEPFSVGDTEGMDEFVEFGSPEKKRVKRDSNSASPSSRLIEGGELSVRKRRRDADERALQMLNTPTAVAARRESLARMRSTPVKFPGLFENITASMATPPSASAAAAAESLFGTPGRLSSIKQPLFEMKTAKERKEERRRRMTKEFREFSAINMDILKGWLPPTTVVEEPEEVGEEGKEKEQTKEEMEVIVEKETETDGDGDSGMTDDNKEATSESTAPTAEAAISPVKPAAPTQATTKSAPSTPAPPEGFTLPAPIPQRTVTILPASQVLTRTRRSNSAPPVPHAASNVNNEDEEEEADISISPLAQEMITSLQQRIAVLQHELDTSNAALAKATAQLVGEMRARRAAEDVKEYMEMEKQFGVCCKHAIAANATKKNAKSQVQQTTTISKTTTAGQYATASIHATSTPVPTVSATAGKKRTRDEREQSIPPPPPPPAPLVATRSAAQRSMPEKRVFSATAAQQPTRPSRIHKITSSTPALSSTTTNSTTAGQPPAKKPAKTALGQASSNTHHPPITTGMEKPAVRGITRPRSRMGDREEELAAPLGRRTRAGSVAAEGTRPLSRYGDRPVRTITRDESGLDVFGRLAGGARSRR